MHGTGNKFIGIKDAICVHRDTQTTSTWTGPHQKHCTVDHPSPLHLPWPHAPM